MKQGRFILLILVAFLLVAGIAFYLAANTRQVDDTSEIELVSHDEAKSSVLPRPVAPHLGNMDEEIINEPDSNQQKAFAAAFLTPISFWGKVVDESGNPIPEAVVELGANDNPNPLGEGSTYRRETDASGMFSIQNIRGISLSVRVSKDGYISTDRSRGRANYVLPNNTDIPVPTPDEPALFVLIKMGESAALMRSEGSVTIPKDGTPVTIDLQTGRPSQGGGLRIQCVVQDQNIDTSVYNPYDWRCVVVVPGGGLTERSDNLNFIAPEDGYQPSAVIEMPKGSESWRPQVSREYFIKRDNGTFALLQIRVVTGTNTFVRFVSYINPEGGDRNLQYDPAKRIR